MLSFGYLYLGNSDRLWSFAMWLAFPTSDYYDHSVTQPGICGLLTLASLVEFLTFIVMDSYEMP